MSKLENMILSLNTMYESGNVSRKAVMNSCVEILNDFQLEDVIEFYPSIDSDSSIWNRAVFSELIMVISSNASRDDYANHVTLLKDKYGCNNEMLNVYVMNYFVSNRSASVEVIGEDEAEYLIETLKHQNGITASLIRNLYRVWKNDYASSIEGVDEMFTKAMWIAVLPSSFKSLAESCLS